ncbi:MAG: hypothetical protein O3C28_08000 [Proteobacteria bacterium]|nr:hypothetical protein [Pseudomonadota bacterium]
MFNRSVVTLTGQMWKMLVGVVLMLVGSVAPAFESIGMSWTVGTIVATIAYGFVIVAITCPKCQQRWFLQALVHAEQYGPLFKGSACPVCSHDFSAGDYVR